jgi:CrcB protein
VTPAAWERARLVTAIFIGGCAGGLLRHRVLLAWPVVGDQVPWPVVAVNATGALVLGLVLVAAAARPGLTLLRPLLATGFCGALTTFSTVVVGADELIASGAWPTAAAYVGASVVSGLAAVTTGLALGRAVVR